MTDNINKIFRMFYPAQRPEDIRREYSLPERLDITVETAKNGYLVLTCKELPGLITEAKDGKKLIKMFNDAVLTYYDIPRRTGDVVYDRLNIPGYGTFRIADNKIMQEAS